MVIGIGCDIVAHDTTKDLNWASDQSLLQRIFSQNEIELYNLNKTVKFLDGRFAAKEAVLKCLGTGMHDGISLTQIQILQSPSRKPIVELSGLVKQISDEMGVSFWHVTITHSLKYSLAFVVAESR